ncbi:MAG: VOC family protein [Acidobacteria bacterium]|nr:VOC family protein [Acidobacteriota bacterium]
MPVREFFHLMHIVDDFDAAEAFFGDLFSPVTFVPKHWSDLDKRFASLARVGDDFVLELMEVSTLDADQSAPLPKFRSRFGQHFHSLSWLIDDDDVQAVFDELRSSVRVVDPTGGLFPHEGPATAPRVMFTHPRDTFGQLEFMTASFGRAADPMHAPGWSSSFWHDEQPLGIQRTSHLTTMVSDLARAKEVYGLFGGRVFHEQTDDEAARAYVFVGNQTVVELAQPISADSQIAKDQQHTTDLPHAATFAVRDLDAVERHVEKLGVRVAERSGETLLLEPDDCFGALYGFTTAPVPNDPRG